MLPTVKKGCHVDERSAEFQVTNFEATCAFISERGNFSNRYHNLTSDIDSFEHFFIESGPLISVGHSQFGVKLIWDTHRVSGRKHPSIARDRPLHVGVQRIFFDANDSTEEVLDERQIGSLSDCVMANSKVTLLNEDSAKNIAVSMGFSDFGQNLRASSLAFGGLTFSNVIDRSGGWLHGGALRVELEMVVVLGFDEDGSVLPVSNMQQEVCKSLKCLLTSGLLSDTTLKVGDVEIEAHSQILAAMSPVFAAMFSTPMREALTKGVTIEDSDVMAAKELLQFMYCGEVSVEVLENADSAMMLLKIAHRYEVRLLVEICTRALGAKFTPETVCDMLYVADLLCCSVFKTHCLEYIRRHLCEVQGTQTYARLVETQPTLLNDIIAAISGYHSFRIAPATTAEAASDKAPPDGLDLVGHS